MKYGNCLIYAVSEILRNGGGLYIEWYPENIFPHFSVERKGKVYDYGHFDDSTNDFWYRGEVRSFRRNKYKRIMRFEHCKRKMVVRI